LAMPAPAMPPISACDDDVAIPATRSGSSTRSPRRARRR
jgi:hypothetical protein